MVSRPDGSDSEWPDGLAVVLIHGAMDRGAGMARLTRRLADAESIRYDRRGYGHARTMPPVGIDGQVADLVEIIDGRAVVLFGHSFGGLVALTCAARQRADVRAVVVYEAPTPWAPWWPPWPAIANDQSPADVAERFLRSMIGDDRWDRLPAKTRAQRRAEGDALLADVATGSDGNSPFDPATITVPTIVSHGTASSSDYAKAADLLASSIPQAELHRLDGLAHGAPLAGSHAIATLIRRGAALAVPTDRLPGDIETGR